MRMVRSVHVTVLVTVDLECLTPVFFSFFSCFFYPLYYYLLTYKHCRLFIYTLFQIIPIDFHKLMNPCNVPRVCTAALRRLHIIQILLLLLLLFKIKIMARFICLFFLKKFLKTYSLMAKWELFFSIGEWTNQK